MNNFLKRTRLAIISPQHLFIRFLCLVERLRLTYTSNVSKPTELLYPCTESCHIHIRRYFTTVCFQLEVVALVECCTLQAATSSSPCPYHQRSCCLSVFLNVDRERPFLSAAAVSSWVLLIRGQSVIPLVQDKDEQGRPVECSLDNQRCSLDSH